MANSGAAGPHPRKPKPGVVIYEDGRYGKPYKGEKAPNQASPGARQFQREIKVRAERYDMDKYKAQALKDRLAKKKMQ